MLPNFHPSLHVIVRCALCLWCIVMTLDASCQNRPTRKERVATRRQERLDARMDPHKWDRMTWWSAGPVFSSGYSGEGSMSDQLDEVGVEKGIAYRAEASRRLQKGWYVMSSVEHNSFRTGGITDRELVMSWSDGWFESTSLYQADFVTMQHDVTTLNMMTGALNAPFPRRKDVGMTISFAAGLAAHIVSGDHGVRRRQQFTVESSFLDGLFSDDAPEVDVLSKWSRRYPCGTQWSAGLSATMELRAELWLGRQVSLLVPAVSVTLPLLRPHFNAVSDAEGEVLEAYDLDLTALRIGTGLIVHF